MFTKAIACPFAIALSPLVVRPRNAEEQTPTDDLAGNGILTYVSTVKSLDGFMTGIRGASLEDLLQALAASKPTRQSVEALLKVHAPALARVFEAGWTDAEIVDAFLKDEENGKDRAELVRLLQMARKQERAGVKRIKRTRQWNAAPRPRPKGEGPQTDQIADSLIAEASRKPRARGV